MTRLGAWEGIETYFKILEFQDPENRITAIKNGLIADQKHI